MTVRVTFHQTCDRCESPFVEKFLKAGDKVPTLKSKGIAIYKTTTTDGETEQSAKPYVAYNDLCAKCAGVVEKALATLAPPGSTGAKPKKKRGRPSKAEIAAREAAKAEEEAKAEAKPEPEPEPTPKVEEYSEPEPTPEPTKEEIHVEEKHEAEKVEAADDEVVDLGLAGDPVGEPEEDPEDPFAGRETFEDPDTGDIKDVHTGEILAKREPEAGVAAGDVHPF